MSTLLGKYKKFVFSYKNSIVKCKKSTFDQKIMIPDWNVIDIIMPKWIHYCENNSGTNNYYAEAVFLVVVRIHVPIELRVALLVSSNNPVPHLSVPVGVYTLFREEERFAY